MLRQRLAPLEQFLRTIGIDPAQTTSRNPLAASPALSKVEGWSLSAEEFVRRVGKTLKVSLSGTMSETFKVYEQAREEALSFTEEIVRVEKEIDERVKGLYGL